MKKNLILIVDDEELNLYFLREVLKEYDFDVIEATNGQKAIDACHENNDIKLILMDIKMPVMDGLTATEIIKSDFPHIKVVAQTAYAFAYDEDKALSYGCDDYLTKPITLRNLAKIFSKYELA